VTVLVGPNRAGTSNVAWAIAVALDPARRYRPERDRPRTHDGHPQVQLTRADGQRGRVHWDPATGERQVDGPLPQGHVVLARVHETPRDLLRRAPLDLTGTTARDRLAGAILTVSRTLLPEVAEVLVPADLAVAVHDDLGSTLPVPETRAMVALGLAQHVTERGTPPVAVVIEAPDAFLHPAAQEVMAEQLVTTAASIGVPVVITTSSPFAIPRVAEATVVALARDASGRTDVVGVGRG
jgi:hypothetical protein